MEYSIQTFQVFGQMKHTNMDLTTLQQQVAELMAWKKQKELQQISYPLDITSVNILSKYFLSFVNFFSTTGGAAGNLFSNMIVKQNNKSIAMSIWTALINITPNYSTHVFTLNIALTTGAQGKVSNGTFVQIFSPDPGTTPTLLDNGGGYFVVNTSGNTFQLSATKGGSAIAFTDNGTGLQYIIY
jgi:hypothetical protein